MLEPVTYMLEQDTSSPPHTHHTTAPIHPLLSDRTQGLLCGQCVLLLASMGLIPVAQRKAFLAPEHLERQMEFI